MMARASSSSGGSACRMWSPVRTAILRWRRRVWTSFLIEVPVVRSSQWLTARAAITMVRWASMDSRLWVVDRAGAEIGLGHPEALLDLPQLVVGAEHVFRS